MEEQPLLLVINKLKENMSSRPLTSQVLTFSYSSLIALLNKNGDKANDTLFYNNYFIIKYIFIDLYDNNFKPHSSLVVIITNYVDFEQVYRLM